MKKYRSEVNIQEQIAKLRQKYNCKELSDVEESGVSDTTKACLQGLEFGYNKANEWHYTKDGEYPNENQLVLLYRENPNGANIALTYWYKSYVIDKVIAWKEVTPPKE